ncbi:unnamed protein product [Anisakis simplex]|uniref:Peroxisomal membrane protein PEX14 n=1 Tax=Anisakis simplex TaxID=6269 RepID=A0A0M3JAS6_ANISI|nr:unnamed protein product [Anisakis simplex]
MDKTEDLNDEIGQAGDSLQQADSECQTENVISSVDNSNTNNTDANRPEMIDTAVRFMSDPKVQRTSFENQKRFLRSKGVSDAEIEQAKQIVISQSQTIAECPSVITDYMRFSGHLL